MAKHTEHGESEEKEAELAIDHDASAEDQSKESEHHEHPGDENHRPIRLKAKGGKFSECWRWFTLHKTVSVPGAIVLLLLVLGVVPFTRYALAGMFMKQTFPVMVLDATNGTPVSSALVSLDGKKVLTDGKGNAKLQVPVGHATLMVSKQYYKSNSQDVLVPINRPKAMFAVRLEATGRQVPIAVLNKISGKGVSGASITVAGTQAKTDEKGTAVVVVPAGQNELKATVTADGYNQQEVTVKVTEQADAANKFTLVPEGKIYFLSNASGKIDLVKSDLDGSNRKTVLAGTGKEDKFNTVLLATRDWKYIALLSKRDGGTSAKLFLIDTTDNDKLTTIDEGDATFTIAGWSGTHLVYTVVRDKVGFDQPKRQALKTFDAASKKLATLDETSSATMDGGGAYGYEQFAGVYVIDQDIAYAMTWYPGGYLGINKVSDKTSRFNVVPAAGGDKKTLKTYPVTINGNSISTRTGEFGEIYIHYDGASKQDEYSGGKITASNLTANQFYEDEYNTYVVSPSGTKTLWSEFRDGKYVFFVGNSKGENGKEIGSSGDYSAYGWFTDDYVLLTKKGSEMHIMPADGLSGGVEASPKISDYYKPNYYNGGFGYGYGG